MKPRLAAAAALLLFQAGAALAQQDTQGCIGQTPPFKNTCAYGITVWYKAAKGGTVKTVNLVPGDSAPHFLTPEEKAGVVAAVCRQGEKAYEFSGIHGNTPWAGTGGYECRKS